MLLIKQHMKTQSESFMKEYQTRPSHLFWFPLLAPEVITEAAPAEYPSCACKSYGEAVRRCQATEGHPELLSERCEAADVSKLPTWPRNELSSHARAGARQCCFPGIITGAPTGFVRFYSLNSLLRVLQQQRHWIWRCTFALVFNLNHV